MLPELLVHREALTQVVAGELPRFQIPWRHQTHSNGPMACIAMRFLPRRDQAGQIIGLLHVAYDATGTGALEQEVIQQRNDLLLARDQLAQQNARLMTENAEFQRLDALKSSFVSIAAHELRTPLTSIMGYLELLSGEEAGPLNEQQTEFLKTIEGAAQRLVHITNDLLDVTRLEAGRLNLVLQPVDLAALVKTTIAEQATGLEAKSQQVSLQAPASLPPALCDTNRAGQIIGNLINNAGKFSPSGATILVRLAESPDPGYLQVSVTDQGKGIPPESQTMLFKPFGRVGGVGPNGADGVGLGLYIARSLVELHGGRMWLESLPAEGTTFYVSLPIADQAPAK